MVTRKVPLPEKPELTNRRESRDLTENVPEYGCPAPPPTGNEENLDRFAVTHFVRDFMD
jgi:hypothetical protein